MTSEPELKLPAWFTPAVHAVTPAGIVRAADQALLADDGLPASNALRAAEERAAARAAPAQSPDQPPAEIPAAPKTKKTEA